MPIHIPRVLIGNIVDKRACISLAALLVKVTANTPAGETWEVCISQAMRVVSTRVLPEPAPASMSAGWAGSVTAASCSGLRWSRRLCIPRLYADASNQCAKLQPNYLLMCELQFFFCVRGFAHLIALLRYIV